jgi:hypothetical protein
MRARHLAAALILVLLPSLAMASDHRSWKIVVGGGIAGATRGDNNGWAQTSGSCWFLGVETPLRRWLAIGSDVGYYAFPEGVTPGQTEYSALVHQSSLFTFLGSARLQTPFRSGIGAFLVAELGAAHAHWGAVYDRDLDQLPVLEQGESFATGLYSSFGFGLRGVWPHPMPEIELSFRLATPPGGRTSGSLSTLRAALTY